MLQKKIKNKGFAFLLKKKSKKARKKIRSSFQVDDESELYGAKKKWAPTEPGPLALCRYKTGGHLKSANLLYWILFRSNRQKGIFRKGAVWTVATAEVWAREAGLSPSEYKNAALPMLKKLQLIEVKTWKFEGIRQTWIRPLRENFPSRYTGEYTNYDEDREKNWSASPYCTSSRYHRKDAIKDGKNSVFIDPDL